VNLAALILGDSRFPGGGHVHSGGLEEAAARGLVTDERSLASFLHGRLHTAGALAAAFASAAAHAARADAPAGHWLDLDAELDARTPSPAQRAASRAQGRGTTRAAKRAWPSPVLDRLLLATPHPHHPIVAGAVSRDPEQAAAVCAYLAVSGPASAAVRLLGLDPFGVNALVADLAPDVEALAADAAVHRGPADLPAPGAPGLDLLAEAHDRHHQEEVRLFVS
jgi:urease accessory protein